MANLLDDVTPKLLAQGLLALRNMNIMPPLVNSDYNSEFADKGTTVNVPIPSAVPIQDVAPGVTSGTTQDVAPITVPVELTEWKEAPFYLTDKDLQQAMNGVIPMQASEAIASIADEVNGYLLGFYKRFYGVVGVPGTTPFAAGTTEATQARKVLTIQKAPLGSRRLVFDPDAEANALELRAFQDVEFGTSAANIQSGELPRKLGFDWHTDQQVQTHTNPNGTPAGWLINDGAVAIGDKDSALDTGANDPVEGDIFTVAGDTQTYVIDSFIAGAITFSPGAQVAWADNAVTTFIGSHVANMAFHRDAIAFASRPLADVAIGNGGAIQTASDPITKLSIRLEITREHKRTRFSYDLLYGAEVVRRELGARIYG